MNDTILQVLTIGLTVGLVGSSLSLLLGHLISSILDGVNKMTKV